MDAKDYVIALRGAKLTQIQIGDGAGISQPNISKIERGIVANVGVNSYKALQALYAQHFSRNGKQRKTAKA